MTTIVLAYEVTDAQEQQIRKLLADLRINDCDFSGVEWNIIRDESTCIPNSDDDCDVGLLHAIHEILKGE